MVEVAFSDWRRFNNMLQTAEKRRKKLLDKRLGASMSDKRAKRIMDEIFRAETKIQFLQAKLDSIESELNYTQREKVARIKKC